MGESHLQLSSLTGFFFFAAQNVPCRLDPSGNTTRGRKSRQWLGMFYAPWLPKEHIPCVDRRSSKRESSISDAGSPSPFSIVILLHTLVTFEHIQAWLSWKGTP